MYILRAFALLLVLAQVVLAEQPAPILPDPKLTPAIRNRSGVCGSVPVCASSYGVFFAYSLFELGRHVRGNWTSVRKLAANWGMRAILWSLDHGL